MTDDAALSAAAGGGDAYVNDDVSTVTSPSCRRAVDFSINGLLSSQVGRTSERGCRPTECMSVSDDKHADRQLLVNCSAGVDSSALLRHRLAAAALWYPWLHNVASLQSTTSKHRLGK